MKQFVVCSLAYFGHLMWRTDSLEKTLMLGKIEGGRKRGWQRMRLLDGTPTRWTWVWVSSGSWWWTGKPGMLQSIESQAVRRNWTELHWTESCLRLKSKQTDKIPEENFVDFCYLKSVGWVFMEIVAVGYTWLEFKDSGHRFIAINFQYTKEYYSNLKH